MMAAATWPGCELGHQSVMSVSLINTVLVAIRCLCGWRRCSAGLLLYL